MKDLVEKKDWENVKTQFENMLINSKVQSEINEVVLDFIKGKLKEFPDEDPAPKEVKEIVEELKK